MPQLPLKPCAYPGCNTLTRERRCEQHKRSNNKEHDKQRGSAAARGYDGRWQRYRINYLRHNPLCLECQRNGRLTPATVVDHIKAHKGDVNLFWDTANHQPLCKRCHDSKTARDDGGFGR